MGIIHNDKYQTWLVLFYNNMGKSCLQEVPHREALYLSQILHSVTVVDLCLRDRWSMFENNYEPGPGKRIHVTDIDSM